MDEQEILARRFEEHRDRLQQVALRMLGSSAEAEDAVQEAWVRLERAANTEIESLGAWLTTVVARVCLDALRSRAARREESLEGQEPERGEGRRHERTPEDDLLLADAVGTAMMIVLETLAPAERVAFVLHDMFDLSFDEIAPIVGRTPVATRQLASRARRRVQGSPPVPPADRDRHQQVIEAFIAASRGGDLGALVAVLAPDVVVRGDAAAVKLGGALEVHGAETAAKLFAGRARAARPGLIDGDLGVIVAPNGKLLLILGITFDGDRISEIEVVADKATLAELELLPLG
jgi:RNA polymerase sigma-70 factor (ECF subfamily)